MVDETTAQPEEGESQEQEETLEGEPEPVSDNLEDMIKQMRSIQRRITEDPPETLAGTQRYLGTVIVEWLVAMLRELIERDHEHEDRLREIEDFLSEEGLGAPEESQSELDAPGSESVAVPLGGIDLDELLGKDVVQYLEDVDALCIRTVASADADMRARAASLRTRTEHLYGLLSMTQARLKGASHG